MNSIIASLKNDLAETNCPIISFIIPAYNEEENIERCLNSIVNIFEKNICEIIVIDNGSTDRTKEIAGNFGALILDRSNCFVGTLRNLGAKATSGKILCFIDADCEITPAWKDQLNFYIPEIINQNIGILGAKYALPDNSNLIQNAWFSHQKLDFIGPIQMIPAGNMIIQKELFLSVGGFNEDITSGEDYELCERIRNKGFKIFHDYRFKCIHYGNPKNIRFFYIRERWHGKGMIADLNDPLKSRPLLISSVYIATYFAFIFICLLSLLKIQMFFILPYLLIPILIPPFIFSFMRSYKSKKLKYFPVLCLLYIVYCFARSISLIEIIYKIIIKHLTLKK